MTGSIEPVNRRVPKRFAKPAKVRPWRANNAARFLRNCPGERPDLRRSGIRYERLLRLDREPDRNIRGTIECLENLAAEQATIFSLHARAGRQFDAAVAGVAGGTGDRKSVV